MMSKGQGCRPDPVRALAWFESAARQGMIESQIAAADMFWAGRGVERDEKAARRWYEEAARAGSEIAVQRLETMRLSAPLPVQA